MRKSDSFKKQLFSILYWAISIFENYVLFLFENWGTLQNRNEL